MCIRFHWLPCLVSSSSAATDDVGNQTPSKLSEEVWVDLTEGWTENHPGGDGGGSDDTDVKDVVLTKALDRSFTFQFRAVRSALLQLRGGTIRAEMWFKEPPAPHPTLSTVSCSGAAAAASGPNAMARFQALKQVEESASFGSPRRDGQGQQQHHHHQPWFDSSSHGIDDLASAHSTNEVQGDSKSKFGGTSSVYASGQEEHVSPLFLAAAAQGGGGVSGMQEPGGDPHDDDGDNGDGDMKRMDSFEDIGGLTGTSGGGGGAGGGSEMEYCMTMVVEILEFIPSKKSYHPVDLYWGSHHAAHDTVATPPSSVEGGGSDGGGAHAAAGQSFPIFQLQKGRHNHSRVAHIVIHQTDSNTQFVLESCNYVLFGPLPLLARPSPPPPPLSSSATHASHQDRPDTRVRLPILSVCSSLAQKSLVIEVELPLNDEWLAQMQEVQASAASSSVGSGEQRRGGDGRRPGATDGGGEAGGSPLNIPNVAVPLEISLWIHGTKEPISLVRSVHFAVSAAKPSSGMLPLGLGRCPSFLSSFLPSFLDICPSLSFLPSLISFLS
jgi:hypothetical protein